MSAYSTPHETSAFIKELGANAFIIDDMDGNKLRGFSINPGKTLPLDAGDDPDNRDIPSGLSMAGIDALVADGTLRETIFAKKAMDVRMPADMVDLINEAVGRDKPFMIGFLTSRSVKDALDILMRSGVRHPERVTLVADSGATMYLRGERHDVYTLTDADSAFLQGMQDGQDKLYGLIKDMVKEAGFDPASCPKPYFERKSTAMNIHYRTILDFYKQGEGSQLDSLLGQVLKTALDHGVAEGPKAQDGTPVFKTLDGPATVEIKIASVNKGHGLEALVRAAMESDTPPTAVVFSGDDVTKANGNPGTDYYAMIKAEAISRAYGVPVRNVHTHHPVDADPNGATPDPQKAPAMLAGYPVPPIHLVVPTPARNVGLTMRILKPARSRGHAPATTPVTGPAP